MQPKRISSNRRRARNVVSRAKLLRLKRADAAKRALENKKTFFGSVLGLPENTAKRYRIKAIPFPRRPANQNQRDKFDFAAIDEAVQLLNRLGSQEKGSDIREFLGENTTASKRRFLSRVWQLWHPEEYLERIFHARPQELRHNAREKNLHEQMHEAVKKARIGLGRCKLGLEF